MYIHSQVISTECSDSQNFVCMYGGGEGCPLLNYIAYLRHSFLSSHGKKKTIIYPSGESYADCAHWLVSSINKATI